MESYVGITHIFTLSYKQIFLFMASCDRIGVMSKSSYTVSDDMCLIYWWTDIISI